ncbi:BTB/POZ domain-containing protein 6-like isoform X1 [Haliotis rufescens]|uniref:BTB/POZ domain-containing protein 6-like isoform X1 n=1 Tax=Haliotis rufescens TaxID=6454 RepID=UPI00201FAB9C|nr:BTB/POZ domain-containing protein 6-like isoform X1 [Haliotis rufescens]XP_048241731.1 BTB/POZ domain-containing protein 6-like isoform X1 [Haliotis rufescens]
MAALNVHQAESASGFVDNWQAWKTLAECNLRMFDAEEICDVTFRVGSTGHVIKAHRYVLISRSCVFHAMFTGPLAETSEVSVPEIEHKDFRQFLLYLYTDNTTVDADNVTALLYASRKYAITALESQCLEFLEKHLNVDNACVILDAAHRFDQSQLFQKAFTLIKDTGERSLQSSGFLTLSQVLLQKIVESDDLLAEEHVIFSAVNSLAEAECRRQGREVTPEIKRTVLGETLLKVRFPLLEQKFLARDVKASGLLTEQERLTIFEYIGCPDNDVKPFNTSQRKQTIAHSITRFSTQYVLQWSVDGKRCDSISFKSSRNLMLCGYSLYGPRVRETKPSAFSATTYFGNEEDVLQCKIQDKTEYKVNSKVFDVVFEKRVAMTAGVWYTLTVLIQGSDTWQGQNGKREILCADGVRFTFRDSKHSKNCTNVDEGQIPSLLFRVA